MARKLKPDWVLFFITVVLVAASIVMVYSASNVIAMEQYRQPNKFLIKQALFAILGVAAMAGAMRIDYRAYRVPAVVWTLLGVALFLLVAVLLVGPKINGTHRWFGLAGIGIQPSEFAKIAVTVFVAAILERRMDRIDEVRYALGPIAITLAAVVGLIMFQPDYGSAVAVVAIVAVMVFAAGLPYRHLLALGACAVPLLAGVAIAEPYRVRRLLAFWRPDQDPLGDGYQVLQSLIAVGTGGVTGRGLGESVQKLFYLPYPHTDFIYAVIGEELGLVGTTLVLVCFCVITWRGLRIASRAPDAFGSFMALGLTTMIAVQALVNISVVLGLMPTKGIPLPFLSSGGSSLVVSLAGMGMLLNISQHASAGE